ncbi:MAG: multiple sugar transport system substrate-binding protein [Parcubacteria group bacterium Gr01-1014_20]|nr:MAG: multiple sugar transport system substrate-binding protein [Parcubacteria group bacterium Gr01-1014_20]
MKFTQKQVVIVLGSVFAVFVVIVLFILNARGPAVGGEREGPKITLAVWGFDDESYFRSLIGEYGKYRKNVKVQYKEFDEDKYEANLIDALASGEGPDVFLIRSRDAYKEKNKISAVPATQLNLVSFQKYFPEVVSQDFVIDGEIYALPLYLDTLALFYNKDFFDQVGITSPPKTWQEFQEDVAKLAVVDREGEIFRAGAAIGGSERSVAHATDLLNLIMLQNGTNMTSQNLGAATFGATVKQKNPGLEAFNFYLQFANAASSYYTWNDNQPDSLDAFASEKVAMIFGYQRDVKAIKDRNSFLKFGVDLVPQPEGALKAVSYADYSGLSVSKQSREKAWAWDFVKYVATTPQVVQGYLDISSRPPAIRDPLIKDKLNDLRLGVFARQALTARGWTQIDSTDIRGIFSSAIQSVLSGQKDSAKALKTAEEQVTGLMREAGK